MRRLLRGSGYIGAIAALLVVVGIVNAQGINYYPSSGGITGITSNGTTMTATLPLLFADGTVGDPSMAWSADADGTGTGWYRRSANLFTFAANGVKKFELGGTYVTSEGLKMLGQYVYVNQKPAGGNLSFPGDASTYLSNVGASALATMTLPSAAQGMIVHAIVEDTDGIKMQTASGDKIQMGPKLTAAQGYVQATAIGSTISLVAVDDVTWYAVAWHGTWTDGTFTASDAAHYTP